MHQAERMTNAIRKVSKQDLDLIDRIVARFEQEFPQHVHENTRTQLVMLLVDVHTNFGAGLELDQMLMGPLPDFAHDIGGMSKHWDTATGTMRDCFDPRFAKEAP
jgi:hypothetical protein